jgi:nitrile hydratase subunit beta
MAHDHDHGDHHHEAHHGSELSPMELRVRALESVLVEKGYVDPSALDALIETYETKVGPHNGARVVARAWVDAGFRARLLADGTPAMHELGVGGRGGEHMVVVANTPDEHNLVVCTLCSCYPWPVLGLPPGEYLTSSYYAIWLKALERQVQTHGLATSEELSSGIVSTPAAPVKRVLQGEEVAPLFARGFPSDRPVPDPARFSVGDRVRARRINPTGHTRLPRYVRGHVGTVEAVHGGFVFPDTNARLAGEAPQWLSTVRFSGRDLWGEQAEAGHAVSVNAFESYLEPVALEASA